MRILDLFSGTGSATKAFENRGHTVIRVELDTQFKADYRDIMQIDLGTLGSFDFIWASPPCTSFSVASIGHYWKRQNGTITAKNIKAEEGLNLVQRTLDIIENLQPTLGYLIENPRGMLRKMSIMQNLPRTTITYCQYGDTRMKPTDLWGQVSGWTPRPACKNGDSCHERAPRGSQTGTQGLKGAKNRSMLPYQLGEELCLALEDYCSARP